MGIDEKLDSLRDAIDGLDDNLLDLLNRRASITKEVGDLKRSAGQSVTFYRPDREAMILNRLMEANSGPIMDGDLVRIMRQIISACLSLEKILKVAYLGPEGTYTHAALREHFGGAVESLPCSDIPEVFSLIESKKSDYGVVPIENSSGGSVNQTLDCLIGSTLKIIGEITLPIRHQLLGIDERLSVISRVYAHEQALTQCGSWLRENLSNAELISTKSNAIAAAKVAEEEGAAAIASTEAAEIYNLKIVASNIEDFAGNSTRFLVLGSDQVGPTGTDRTSLMFSASNVAGSLYGVLGILAANEISMSRIESRPSGDGLWEYMFFVDFLGHANDVAVYKAIDEMKEKCKVFKILGSYPRSVS